MITIFTRKELLITLDMMRQAKVREILSANGIEYSLKVTNLQDASIIGGRRVTVGTIGINLNYSYEYKFYVHRKDYERALYLVSY